MTAISSPIALRIWSITGRPLRVIRTPVRVRSNKVMPSLSSTFDTRRVSVEEVRPRRLAAPAKLPASATSVTYSNPTTSIVFGTRNRRVCAKRYLWSNSLERLSSDKNLTFESCRIDSALPECGRLTERVSPRLHWTCKSSRNLPFVRSRSSTIITLRWALLPLCGFKCSPPAFALPPPTQPRRPRE